MEFCWVLPNFSHNNGKNIISSTIEEAREAEKCGFDSVLVASTPESLDPWVLSTQLVNATKKIRLLVAQNSNHMLPTVTAKAWNSLNLLSSGRIDLNIVTGSSSVALAKDSKPEKHSVRYKRTKEFIEIIKLLRTDIVNYKGEFFEIEGCNIFPNGEFINDSRFFLAGSSREAIDIASQYSDYYLVYGNDVETISNLFKTAKTNAQNLGRKLKCGVYINIVARETSKEAWDYAEQMISETSLHHKKLIKLYYNSVDSVGLTMNKDFNKYDNYKIDNNLWGGLLQISTATATSIVGNYIEVIKNIETYIEHGADYILISSDYDDINRLGTFVIPYFK